MPRITIRFISKKLSSEIQKLEKGSYEDRQVYYFINRAFKDIENNLASCIRIPKKLWLKHYRKYKMNNLWKYELPNGWRIIFFLETDEIKVVAIVLEWFSHKEYERRFRY